LTPTPPALMLAAMDIKGTTGILAVCVLVAACSTASPSPSQAGASATPVAGSPSQAPSATAEPRYTLSGRVVTMELFTCSALQGLDGEEVTVRDAGGTIIGLGEVGERIGDALAWAFEVQDLPASDFYVVEVGDGLDERTFTMAELVGDDWSAVLAPDCPD
jgi:hypothetical protein